MAQARLSKAKIAYLCDRLGPYHFAQLNAASDHAEIIAVEFSAIDQTYAWDVIKDASRFRRITLFKDNPITTQPVTTISSRLRIVLDELRPQVVAITGWEAPASLIALWWCLDSNTPTILMSDSQKHDEIRVWWKELVKKRIVKMNCSGFVAGSTSKKYLESLGIAESRIFTSGGVVDNAHFSEKAIEYQQDAAEVRKRFGLPEKYFLASNRFVKEKNIFLLLEAYEKYRKEKSEKPWKLVILGDGPLKSQIIDRRDGLGLCTDILLPGFKQYEELPAYYGLAGAFILASTKETWGLVVNEAMACGLPVIVSSRCGCAPDLVHRGRNGLTFDPYDSDELAAHMAFVSGNTCNRSEMGLASRNIINCWSLEKYSSNLAKAANAALKADCPRFDYVSKALLWGMIHRHRSYRERKQTHRAVGSSTSKK